MAPRRPSRGSKNSLAPSFRLESLEFRTLFSGNLFLAALRARWEHHHAPPARSAPPASVTSTPSTTAIPAAGAGNSATIVARNIFYANSAFTLGTANGGIGTGGDDNAIATDKTALLPGQISTFNNFSSYQLGINGIMIDFSGTIGSLSAADFAFRVGNDTSAPAANGAGDWSTVSAPAAVSIRPGAGVAGSTRVEITWADHAIQNQWLQVTVLADGNTGLAANDVFYFGNLVGDTGDGTVTSADELAARNNPANFLNPALINNPFDFNRDGRVDANDQLIARGNTGVSLTSISSAALPPVVSYNWHQSTVNGVLNVWAPDPSDFGATWTVNAANANLALYGTDNLPSVTAIQQGQIADCYLLAALGSMAVSHPTQLESLVSWDGSGWAVTWHDQFSGTALVVHTANDFSQYFQAQTGEVWWEVFEKTYAAFRTWNGSTGTNTMVALGWGYPDAALTQLTQPSQYYNTFGQSNAAIYNKLQSALAAQHPIIFQTATNAPTMVQSHAYIITSVFTDSSGTAWVTTYNPWGFYDTRTEADLLQNGIGSIVIGTT